MRTDAGVQLAQRVAVRPRRATYARTVQGDARRSGPLQTREGRSRSGVGRREPSDTAHAAQPTAGLVGPDDAGAGRLDRSAAEAAPVRDPGEDPAAHLLGRGELDRARLAVELDLEREDRAALVLLHGVRVAAQRHERQRRRWIGLGVAGA